MAGGAGTGPAALRDDSVDTALHSAAHGTGALQNIDIAAFAIRQYKGHARHGKSPETVAPGRSLFLLSKARHRAEETGRPVVEQRTGGSTCHRNARIDHQGVGTDVPGLVTGQVKQAGGNLLRMRRTAQW
ncbi:hypothetical protein D3C85_1325930 [compost metagenome]